MAINVDEQNNITEPEVNEEVESMATENKVVVEEVEAENDAQPAKTTSKKSGNKKPSKVKGAFSELKKVTWPNFGSVVKKTAVVLSVTLVFLVVIIGIDQLLYLLYNLLTKNL